MARRSGKKVAIKTSKTTARYDAHHRVLDQTYGVLADLRRELSDSKEAVQARSELLKSFATCPDPQRAWLLLEDYFDKLSLARKDFGSHDWWPQIMARKGQERLEETAHLFLRAGRPLPTELQPHANLSRFAEIQAAEQERAIIDQIETWLMPDPQNHLDAPRASLDVFCELLPDPDRKGFYQILVEFAMTRPRTGLKWRSLTEVIEVTHRAALEKEQFAPADWSFLEWLASNFPEPDLHPEELILSGLPLTQWLARWGGERRLILKGNDGYLGFSGEPAELAPCLKNHEIELSLAQSLRLPSGESLSLDQVKFLDGAPLLALVGQRFYLISNPPPFELIQFWTEQPHLPVRKLSHRLLNHLRKTRAEEDESWTQLCETIAAKPRFTFELLDDTIQLRLRAFSDDNAGLWIWTGHEWMPEEGEALAGDKPRILDAPSLDDAVIWLRRLDWFTPEPGLWVGDANPAFLDALSAAWPSCPKDAVVLSDPGFQRLFLESNPLKPRLVLQGSGIDWFSVSAEWEQEGLKLTAADLRRLAVAQSRFVKLPDAGWVELDLDSVRQAQEALADLGVDDLSSETRKVSMLHAQMAEDSTLELFDGQSKLRALRQKLAKFQAVPNTTVPDGVHAQLRPYQLEGLSFLCHLTQLQLGAILADDMGLGKTLQTLAWLAWKKKRDGKDSKPALVICPASVLHNWKRESHRFTPHFKVLILESGAERHNLRKSIPEHDLIITNYALLRRDLVSLKKFEFGALVLDEAQFIKNPSAQVTQSVKQLKAQQRLALTGTPLENRMLDLWSIVDFVNPGYLGSQTDFLEKYEPKGESAEWERRTARRRLATRLRPILLRRVKKQVAKDLPDRIEERRDCELGESQRKLYLAELRRSREEVLRNVQEKGLAKSKMHVLAALTRLRQICCHPRLVGNDSSSGKTDTLFELLEPLIAEGQKVLIFSQFVQMLRLLEEACAQIGIPTHLLTGETKNRGEVVEAFQKEEGGAVFLLSLRAAGTGLNLTSASYVVLYDPWWNPAVEAQAIDRSHRIGQTQNVFAYRLISPGTVEEKIWELQQRKSQTLSDVLGEEGFAKNLSKSDLEFLFSES